MIEFLIKSTEKYPEKWGENCNSVGMTKEERQNVADLVVGMSCAMTLTTKDTTENPHPVGQSFPHCVENSVEKKNKIVDKTGKTVDGEGKYWFSGFCGKPAGKPGGGVDNPSFPC